MSQLLVPSIFENGQTHQPLSAAEAQSYLSALSAVLFSVIPLNYDYGEWIREYRDIKTVVSSLVQEGEVDYVANVDKAFQQANIHFNVGSDGTAQVDNGNLEWIPGSGLFGQDIKFIDDNFNYDLGYETYSQSGGGGVTLQELAFFRVPDLLGPDWSESPHFNAHPDPRVGGGQ